MNTAPPALHSLSVRIRQDSTQRSGAIVGHAPSETAVLMKMDLAAEGDREEVPLDDLTRLPDELPLDELVAATASLLGETWAATGSDGYGAHILADTARGLTVTISPCGGQDDDLSTLTLSASDGDIAEDGYATLPPTITMTDAAQLLHIEVLSTIAELLRITADFA